MTEHRNKSCACDEIDDNEPHLCAACEVRLSTLRDSGDERISSVIKYAANELREPFLALLKAVWCFSDAICDADVKQQISPEARISFYAALDTAEKILKTAEPGADVTKEVS